MTKREREVVAEALRLARKGVEWVGGETAKLGGHPVSGVSLVMFLPEEHWQLCQTLRGLLLAARSAEGSRRGALLIERVACLN